MVGLSLCKFLIQLGRYEELGSGVNNVTKYLPFYAPGAGAPSFIEDDMFTTVVPLVPVAGQVAGQVTGQVAGQVPVEVMRLLETTVGEMTRTEIQALLKLKGRANFEDRYLKPALGLGLVELTIPDKPKSSKQRYRLSEAGKRALGEVKKQ
jgi:ATP-dependent DNA helicase RecG